MAGPRDDTGTDDRPRPGNIDPVAPADGGSETWGGEGGGGDYRGGPVTSPGEAAAHPGHEGEPEDNPEGNPELM